MYLSYIVLPLENQSTFLIRVPELVLAELNAFPIHSTPYNSNNDLPLVPKQWITNKQVSSQIYTFL